MAALVIVRALCVIFRNQFVGFTYLVACRHANQFNRLSTRRRALCDGGRRHVFQMCARFPHGLSMNFITDGVVKVWATAPVCNEAAEADEHQPRLLGLLAAHTGQVLVTRWSPSGR